MFSFIIGFLYRVSEFKDENKMTAYNLAVVFGPCFLRPEVYSMEDLVEYSLIYIKLVPVKL